MTSQAPDDHGTDKPTTAKESGDASGRSDWHILSGDSEVQRSTVGTFAALSSRLPGKFSAMRTLEYPPWNECNKEIQGARLEKKPREYGIDKWSAKG